jgi:UDP-N-acetylglucosamine:LPS N-acetylglucosamine transferase
MKHQPTSDSLEKDPLWDLLRESPAPEVRPTFVTDTLRAARLAGQETWWSRFRLPVLTSSFGLSAAAAAVVCVLALHTQHPDVIGHSVVVQQSKSPASLTEVQDIIQTEALVAASDHLNEYSDAELASLAGF